MKKFLIMVVIVLALGCTYSLTMVGVGGGVDNLDTRYQVFTKGDVTSEGIWLYGDTFMTECSEQDLNSLVTQSSVIGYQASFRGDYDSALKELRRRNVAVLASDSVDGALLIYGLSDRAGRSVTVGGKQVNVQVAIRGDKITVGTPLIMGSY